MYIFFDIDGQLKFSSELLVTLKFYTVRTQRGFIYTLIAVQALKVTEQQLRT